MRPPGDGLLSRLAVASRPARPWLRITVSPRVAQFMLAAGARPGPNLSGAGLVGDYGHTAERRQPADPSSGSPLGHGLPRFNPSWRWARDLSSRSHPEEGFLEDLGLRWAQRDAGQGRLEIYIESASPLAPGTVVAITVVATGQQELDYFMVFMPDDADIPVAALRVPAFRGWPSVFIRGVRSGAGLGDADTEILERSVSATPAQWAGAWRALAEAREPGDPVREVIEGALLSGVSALMTMGGETMGGELSGAKVAALLGASAIRRTD